jgi:hypothetical protein
VNAVASVAILVREPNVHVHHVSDLILAANHAVVARENRVLLVVISVARTLKLLQVKAVQEVEREEEGVYVNN